MFMITSLRWALSAGLLLTTALADRASPAGHGNVGRVPVLVELFTSEGCSSCPPADQALAQLLEQQPVQGVEVIGLSEHVDYWNHLGWWDPYSQSRFTQRQKDYVLAIPGSSQYTPQTVIDGRTQFIGSQIGRHLDALSSASRKPKAAVDIAVSGETPKGVAMDIKIASLAAQRTDATADIVLAVTEDHLSSQVTRGENEGRQLAHAAVVRSMKPIGRVTGRGSFSDGVFVPLESEWKRPQLHVVVFAQDVKTRAILGASRIRLK